MVFSLIREMEWKNFYIDLVLVPLAVLTIVLYHVFLWYKAKTSPHNTVIGVNSVGRRIWVESMMEDNDKKNILAIQTMRNSIMASILVGTISVILTTGLGAVISSTYSFKQHNPSKELEVFGGHHNELLVAIKYATPLVFLLFSFFFSSLSLRFLTQVNILVNIPLHEPCLITPDYVTQLFDRGCIFNTIATRTLYVACPLLLWILGPVPVFLSCVTMVPALYNLDFVFGPKDSEMRSDDAMEEVKKSKDYYHII